MALPPFPPRWLVKEILGCLHPKPLLCEAVWGRSAARVLSLESAFIEPKDQTSQGAEYHGQARPDKQPEVDRSVQGFGGGWRLDNPGYRGGVDCSTAMIEGSSVGVGSTV